MGTSAVDFIGTHSDPGIAHQSNSSHTCQHSAIGSDGPLKEGSPLKGIFAYPTTKHGGNVHEQRLVAVTSKLPAVPSKTNSHFAAGITYARETELAMQNPATHGFSSLPYSGQWQFRGADRAKAEIAMAGRDSGVIGGRE
jgi:hypothetical protein